MTSMVGRRVRHPDRLVHHLDLHQDHLLRDINVLTIMDPFHVGTTLDRWTIDAVLTNGSINTDRSIHNRHRHSQCRIRPITRMRMRDHVGRMLANAACPITSMVMFHPHRPGGRWTVTFVEINEKNRDCSVRNKFLIRSPNQG